MLSMVRPYPFGYAWFSAARLDRDWMYVRAAAIMRKIYIRQGNQLCIQLLIQCGQ